MPALPAGAHLIGAKNAAAANAEAARKFYEPIIPIVLELQGQGLSLRAIAQELDRRQIKTRYAWDEVTIRYHQVFHPEVEYTPPRWNASQVRRILARAQQVTPETTQPGTPPTAPTSQVVVRSLVSSGSVAGLGTQFSVRDLPQAG